MADETTPQTEKSKPRTKGNVPAADANFGTVITDVATKWTASPKITLIWTTPAKFSIAATSYNQELSKRNDVGRSRPQITLRLKQLDASIDSSLTYVKGYLLELYKDAATSYYASFGIEHQTNKYIFPRDRNKRAESLRLMVTAINANGLGAKEFGTAFWTGIKAEYDTLLGKAITTDGAVATKVSSKNELKKELQKTLNSLIKVLQGNYPDTYKAELRSWGFQKEKY
ncbi:hypothetical protein [Flavobacterium sp.]|uniref:hypothetical protein n=1 Tax=Flavobacterium sp. TaxID=239 RepID=UPI00286E5DEE|nr:hypothetical protein [Flavobacterium sp.]